MPPPKYAPIKKRRSRRAQDFTLTRQQSASQSSTLLPHTKLGGVDNPSRLTKRPSSTTAVSPTTPRASREPDSDSDGACGFDSAWRGSAQL